MDLHKNRKAQGMSMASILIGGGVVLVVATLLLAFSSDIINDINDFTALSFADNISDQGEVGLSNLSDQFGNVGTLLGVSVILGLVIGVAAIARFRRE